MIPRIDPKVDYAFKHLFGRDSTRPILIDVIDSVLIVKVARMEGRTEGTIGIIHFCERMLNRPETQASNSHVCHWTTWLVWRSSCKHNCSGNAGTRSEVRGDCRKWR